MVLTGRYLGILAGPLVAAGMFEWTADWITVAWTFVAIAVLTIAGTLYLGVRIRALRAPEIRA